MKRTATGEHEFELPFDYTQYATQFFITYSQNNSVVLELSEKDLGTSVSIEGAIMYVHLSQEDTKKFVAGEAWAEIKLYTKDKKSIISDKIPIYIQDVLNEKVFA